jgi:hypothetical protein
MKRKYLFTQNHPAVSTNIMHATMKNTKGQKLCYPLLRVNKLFILVINSFQLPNKTQINI